MVSQTFAPLMRLNLPPIKNVTKVVFIFELDLLLGGKFQSKYSYFAFVQQLVYQGILA